MRKQPWWSLRPKGGVCKVYEHELSLGFTQVLLAHRSCRRSISQRLSLTTLLTFSIPRVFGSRPQSSSLGRPYLTSETIKSSLNSLRSILNSLSRFMDRGQAPSSPVPVFGEGRPVPSRIGWLCTPGLSCRLCQTLGLEHSEELSVHIRQAKAVPAFISQK